MSNEPKEPVMGRGPMGWNGATARVVYTKNVGGGSPVAILSASLYGWSTVAPSAPAAAGDPWGYVGGSAERIVYRAANAHIHELSLTPTGWGDYDMSGVQGPRAAGDPMGYVTESGRARVLLRGVDNHIHSICLEDSGWVHDDLTALSHAPLADGDPFGYVGGGAERIVYRSANGHIQELSLVMNGVWGFYDMSGVQGPKAIGNPMGYVSAAGTARVLFCSVDNHVRSIELTSNAWEPADLTTASNATKSLGDPFGYVGGGAERIVSKGDRRHVLEINLAPGSPWGFFDMSGTHLPYDDAGPTAFVAAGTASVLICNDIGGGVAAPYSAQLLEQGWQVTSFPFQDAPPVPGLTASTTTTTIQLSWGAPATTFDGNYQVLVTDAQGSTVWSSTTRSTSVTITALNPGETYQASVSYLRDDGRVGKANLHATTVALQTVVPALVGLNLKQAHVATANAHLGEADFAQTSTLETDQTKLQVTSQSPNAGASVNQGTTVQVGFKPIQGPPQGFASVVIYNENTDGRAVSLYLMDATQLAQSSSQGTVAMGASTTITLSESGHLYWVVAIDPGLEGCTVPGPLQTACQRAQVYVPALSGGAVYPLTIS